MHWEKLRSSKWEIFRAAVPGGWLVLCHVQWMHPVGLTFLPDPEHRWDGTSPTVRPALREQ